MREYIRDMFNKLKKTVLDVNSKDTGFKLAKSKKFTSALPALVMSLFLSSSFVMADEGGISTLFTKLKGLLKEVFNGVDSVMTAATIVVIGVGFLIRIFSKNQRTVDEATTWIKRAVITLIVWKFLGLFVKTLDGTSKGNSYEWK